MGTEDWIPKDTKLVTNTKKQRLKIFEQRLDSQKYKIFLKNCKNYEIHIYEICFKIGFLAR